PPHTIFRPSILCAPHSNPTPALHTLSLHDALPISLPPHPSSRSQSEASCRAPQLWRAISWRPCPSKAYQRQQWQQQGRQLIARQDRKSTRLNSSHSQNSYAVFCLKKKKNTNKNLQK